MRIMIPLFIIVLFFCSSCQLGFVNVEDGNMTISIETGSYWLHDYPLWGPIIKKNPPTFAIWLTDENDVYIRTVYASKKVSSANWIANDDSRPESLPQWFRQRGGQPTEENPETDALTSATPRQSFTCTDDSGSLERFKIWFEINHSIDYNQYFTSELFDEDDFQFNGGTGGSGQPAVVYCLEIDRNVGDHGVREMEILGHSDPGGASGIIYQDLSQLSTALEIVQSVTVDIRNLP